MPWAKLFVDIDRLNITKMLSLYYHKKQTEDLDDILIMKDIIDNNPTMFANENHATYFFENVKTLFKTRINWKTFVKEINNYNYNYNYKLLLSNILLALEENLLPFKQTYIL